MWYGNKLSDGMSPCHIRGPLFPLSFLRVVILGGVEGIRIFGGEFLINPEETKASVLPQIVSTLFIAGPSLLSSHFRDS